MREDSSKRLDVNMEKTKRYNINGVKCAVQRITRKQLLLLEDKLILYLVTWNFRSYWTAIV